MVQTHLLQSCREYLTDPIDPKKTPYPTDRLKLLSSILLGYAPGKWRMRARQILTTTQPWLVSLANNEVSSIARRIETYGDKDDLAAALPHIVQQTRERVESVATVIEVAEDMADDTSMAQAADTSMAQRMGEKAVAFKVADCAFKTGKRADHDQLPPSIQACYESALPILRQQRAAFEKAKAMVAVIEKKLKDGKAACDIEEDCFQCTEATKEIMAANEKRLSLWAKYDAYVIGQDDDSLEGTLEEQDLATMRAHISKIIKRAKAVKDDPTQKPKYQKEVEAIKVRVEVFTRRGGTFGKKAVGQLAELGITVNGTIDETEN